MTDVVEIARSRRSRLAAEIVRLDDFIQMAESLLKHGDGPDWGTRGDRGDEPTRPLSGRGADNGGSRDSVAASGSNATSPTARTEIAPKDARGADAGGAAAHAEAGSPARDTGNSNEDPDHFDFGAQASAQEEELVLTDDASVDDARVDAAIGLKIRQRRWMLGLTKKQLADRLGVDVEEIQKSERGEARFGTNRLWHLAAALEVPMSYFYDMTEEQGSKTSTVHAGDNGQQAPLQAREVALAKTA